MNDRYGQTRDRFDSFGMETPYAGEGAGTFDTLEWLDVEAEAPSLAMAWSKEEEFSPGGDGLTDEVWHEGEGEGEAPWSPLASAEGFVPPADPDPPKLARMLALPGRFGDPKRDPAVEMDGTRFDRFLGGADRRDFAARWLAQRPELARAAAEKNADLKSGDIAKAWFVIHDVGAGGTLKDERYRALQKETKAGAVHGFLNRAGYFAATHDFATNRMGTVYEFLSKKGREVAGKTTINIETVPDIEVVRTVPDGSLPPPRNALNYASIGFVRRRPNRASATYFKWTRAAFEVLADLYILASARAGHLLTVTAHKEVDRNLARSKIWNEYSAAEIRNGQGKFWRTVRENPGDYHGDPYGFDMQAFYDAITAKLNALGGMQMPAGARYGVHPARLRKADGQDIVNGDTQLHQFPWQSDPVLKRDTQIKKAGWWASGSRSEAAGELDEGPESEGWHEFADTFDEGEEEWSQAGAESGEHWLEAEEQFADSSADSASGEGEDEWSEAGEIPWESAEVMTRKPAPPPALALVRAIPDSPDFRRYVPIEYRLDAKAIVGELAGDMSQGHSAHKWVERAHFGVVALEIATLAGALAIAAPLLAAAANFMALGAGYQEAAMKVAAKAAASGFSHGVVMGADRRRASLVRDYFGTTRFPSNPHLPQGQAIETANYRLGLLAGYLHGRALSTNRRAIFWRDLGQRMGDQSHRGDSKTWTRREWVDWYIAVGGAFRRHHLQEAD